VGPTEFLSRTNEARDVLKAFGKYVCQFFRSFGLIGALNPMFEFLPKLGQKRRSPETIEVDPTTEFLSRTKKERDVEETFRKYVCQVFRSFGPIGASTLCCVLCFGYSTNK
jgi:hypothetical protein